MLKLSWIVTSLSVIALGFVFSPVLGQKASQAQLDNITDIVLNFYVGHAEILDADETSFFSDGKIILRKDDQYAVMMQYGNLVVPYGKYLFDSPLRTGAGYISDYDLMTNFRPHPNAEAFHATQFANRLAKVRSPETGLYGFIDTKGNERIPLTFNEVTYATTSLYLRCVATGTRRAQNGKLERYLVLPFADSVETRIKDEELSKQIGLIKRHHYWVIKGKDRYDGFSRFFNLVGDSVFITHRKAHYYGSNLFRVDSSFNGLNKTEFINEKDSVVIPFQSYTHFDMTHFQPDSQQGAVSVLTGSGERPYFDYALMDNNGKIYSRLGTGSNDNTITLPEGKEILRGRLVVYMEKPGADSHHYLWDVTQDGKLINIKDLFVENNQDFLAQYGDALKSYEFTFISREGARYITAQDYIKFEFSMYLKPDPRIMARHPWAKKHYTGGFGEKQLEGISVTGYGLMDERTGKILAPPIFSAISHVDSPSGMAYAELTVDKKIYKGFIKTGIGNAEIKGQAQFKFLLKD